MQQMQLFFRDVFDKEEDFPLMFVAFGGNVRLVESKPCIRQRIIDKEGLRKRMSVMRLNNLEFPCVFKRMISNP